MWRPHLLQSHDVHAGRVAHLHRIRHATAHQGALPPPSRRLRPACLQPLKPCEAAPAILLLARRVSTIVLRPGAGARVELGGRCVDAHRGVQETLQRRRGHRLVRCALDDNVMPDPRMRMRVSVQHHGLVTVSFLAAVLLQEGCSPCGGLMRAAMCALVCLPVLTAVPVPWGPRYVVPLVFYTMLRRWTTRRSEEKWPHRPLAGDEVIARVYTADRRHCRLCTQIPQLKSFESTSAGSRTRTRSRTMWWRTWRRSWCPPRATPPARSRWALRNP